MTRSSDSQQKKKEKKRVNFVVTADYREKLKESEKRDKYLDLARELKKNPGTETLTQTVTSALGMVSKG